jgi:hypothetical protein
MDLLTKFEWSMKIKNLREEKYKILISEEEKDKWWSKKFINDLSLTPFGYAAFTDADIEFIKYNVEIPIFTGNIILGFIHIPFPYFLIKTDAISYNFYIENKEYAMLLTFLDNNIESFLNTFRKNK